MSITRGVLAQSPEPEAHDKVLDNNPEGKTGVPGEKPFGARTRTNNKLNPHRTRESNPGHIGGRPAWEWNKY